MDQQPSSPDPTPDEEVARLQHEIEETRAGMSGTVHALEARLNPADVAEKVGAELKRVVDIELEQAKGLLRSEINEAEDKIKRGLGEARAAVKEDVKQAFDGAKQALRAATVGKVEDLATNIGDKMNQARETIMDTVRSNPVPAALVGVGVVWLLMNRSRTAGGATGALSNAAHQASGAAGRGFEQVAGAVSGAAHGAAERTAELGHRAGEAASHLVHQASDAAASAADGAKRGARRVEAGLREGLHNNPLAVGAGVLAIGAIVGYSLPRTEREDALMGDARDRMLHMAGEAAEQGASSVATLADQALEGAKGAVQSSGGAEASTTG